MLLPRALACIASITLLLAVCSPASADDCPFADAQAAQATPEQLEDATLCLLGDQQAAHGVAAEKVSRPLAETATRYARYMVANRHFDHTDLAGHNVFDRVRAADSSFADGLHMVGENLGWGSYELSTPRAMVTAWMNSPGHRANILYPRFQLIGVGVADGAPRSGEPNALTYALVFGERFPSRASSPRLARRRQRAFRARGPGAVPPPQASASGR